jgi:hypothetical protein
MGKKLFKLLLITTAGIFLCGIILSGCSVFRADSEFGGEEIYEVTAEKMAPAESEYAVSEEALAPEGEGMAAVEEAAEEPGYGSDLPSNLDRKIIKSAYIELEIESGKFESSLFKISSLAEQNGGFVSNTQSYSDSEGNLTSGRINIRIPCGNFDFVVDKVRAIGTVESISMSGQDVTQEYVDLESRLRNLKVQEEVLLDLMSQSKTVADSIEVQRELSYVQGEIEVIKGRMNYLDTMISFSTIDVYLHEPEPIRTTPGWGFFNALKRGLRGAVKVFNGIVVFLIVMSPVLVLIAIILIIVWLIIRARKRRRAKKE